MTNEIKHALLSPSQASKWTKAPAEAIYNYLLPQSTSEAAERGTKLHKAIASYLDDFKKTQFNLRIPAKITDLNEADAATAIAVIKEFKKWLKKHNPDLSKVQWAAIEHKVNFDFLIKDLPSYKESGLEEAGFGTSDLLMLIDNVLYVIDFKFGRHMVSAQDNPQLMLYAAANLDRYKAFAEKLDNIANLDFYVTKVSRLIIAQHYDKDFFSPLIDRLLEQYPSQLLGLQSAVDALTAEVISKLSALRFIHDKLDALPQDHISAVDLKVKLEAAIANLEGWLVSMQIFFDKEIVDKEALEINTYIRSMMNDKVYMHDCLPEGGHKAFIGVVDRLHNLRRSLIESVPIASDRDWSLTPKDRALFINNCSIPSDIKQVVTVIIQPLPDSDGKVSIDSASYTPAEVIEFVNQYVPTMDRILQLYNGTVQLAPSDFDLSCKYSNAPGIFNMLLVDKFNEFIRLKALPETDLSTILELAPYVERLIKEARQQAEEVLSKGGKVPGFELRDSVRKPLKWSTADVEVIKQKCPGVDLYESKLKSPATVIKELTETLGKDEAERCVESVAYREPSNKVIVPEIPIIEFDN